jgi:ABC-type spermidine/putrescine transport system permease subunit II
VRRPSGLGVVSAVILLLLYAPIALVAVDSVNGDVLLLGWGGFTTRWYHQAVNDPDVRSALVTSLEVALLSTAFSLVIAIAAALWARRVSERRRRVLDSTTYMRIIMPETVVAIGLFLLLRRENVALGVGTIVIGHVIFNSAFATIIIQARVATLSTALEEAAADLGATPWRAFRRVTVPLILPAVIAAALLVFSFSFDDVVTSLFLGGPNAQTLPVLLLGLIRLHVTPEVNAIGVLVMLTTAAMFALAAVLMSVRVTAGARAVPADA